MITIALASRERPKLFCRMLDSVKENTGGTWEMLVAVDDDDPQLRDYPVDMNIKYIKGPRRNTPQMFNELIRLARTNTIACIADDVMIETVLWDRIVLRHTDQAKYFMMLTNDGGRTNSFHPIISKSINDALDGRMFNEKLTHYYMDPWIEEICMMAGICYKIPSVVFRHIQDIRETESFRKHMENADNDRALFEATKEMRKAYAVKLMKAMGVQ